MLSPYHKYVSEYARLLSEGSAYPLGDFPPAARGALAKDAPRALLFSPHPDDESITGALPLRLLREMKYNLINVAITLGSRKDRQPERLAELGAACNYLGFDLALTAERGLENIDLTTREQSPEIWNKSVQTIAAIIVEHQPRIIFTPHAKDGHPTHIGTHALINDALKQLDTTFCCWVCETEFWAPLTNPNLLIESSVADVADLVTAISFHVGEVRRNPYHLRLPAWMQDNVRRGGELVGGPGAAPPAFGFATLYRLRKWIHRRYLDVVKKGKFLSCNDSLGDLFG